MSESNQQTSIKTWDEFIEMYNPENLIIQYWRVSSIQQSISTKRITFREIKDMFGMYKHKVFGECDCGILYYYEWLNYLNNISNINKPLPTKNLVQLSTILYTKYYYFYLSDLKLILEKILEGEYGKFYGSVDAQLIMCAFKEYSIKRKQVEYEMNLKNR